MFTDTIFTKFQNNLAPELEELNVSNTIFEQSFNLIHSEFPTLRKKIGRS